MIDWYLEPIENHLVYIKQLFEQNKDHRHAQNYSKWTLFEYTKFARMGYRDDKLIYYSAGIERPEYEGSIRIMSRHTRDRSYSWGTLQQELQRGNETLTLSTNCALSLGYKNIWVSREENPRLLQWFQTNNTYTWELNQEEVPRGGLQWVLQKV
jgi:hypothetical protein